MLKTKIKRKILQNKIFNVPRKININIGKIQAKTSQTSKQKTWRLEDNGKSL